MKIAGLLKSSLIDFPGYVAAVIFTQGCNFRCGFCHNPELLDITDNSKLLDTEEILKFLEQRKGKLDGVVITGGEPTMQSELYAFIKKIKELGFLVKLDTNGTNPKVLKQLLENECIDFIAMDIKGPLENYESICGKTNLISIKESIDLVKNSGLEYEFRTTVLPFYHKVSDFELVGELLKGAKKYTIQGFRPQITLESDLKTQRPFNLDELKEIGEIAKKYVNEVRIIPNL